MLNEEYLKLLKNTTPVYTGYVDKTTKGEKNMPKTTTNTKTNANKKGANSMKNTNTSTKANTKASTKRGNNMKSNEVILTEILEKVNGIATRVSNIESRVETLENAPKTTAKGTKKTAKATETSKKSSKGTTSVSKKSTKKEAPAQTWTEKKAEFASQFTDEEKAEYVFKKNLKHKAQKFAYANTSFEERVAKKEWNKVYNANLETLKNAIEELIGGEVTTENELVKAFFMENGIKKAGRSVKGKVKFVR